MKYPLSSDTKLKAASGRTYRYVNLVAIPGLAF